ncbi:MAG: energy transducer TonB [Candidatus Eremiobacteraeota bacterium]|nr:energy transducer TonB [Candidatus Eremiobacteraeota bacterium]
MKPSSFIAAFTIAAVAAFAAPRAARAQVGYVAPKLLKQGTYTSPIAGPGTVIVKVLVNANGSFKVQDIIKSTNHGDDAPALEIARTSKYKPALRGGKPALAFYDFSLKFTGKSVSSEESGSGGDITRYNAMINAGNYAGAKSGLSDYLSAHPGDQQASLALGAADALLKDYAGAVKAFDAAGTIPQKYSALAGLSYAQYATEQSNAKNGTEALASARKAVQLSPNVATYNALGLSALAANDGASAIDAFQRDASLAANDPKATNKMKATIQANLASAYSETGAMDKAKAAAAEAQRLDPNSSAAQTVVANSYVQKAQDLEKDGKFADAAAQWEQAAGAYPSQAVTFYGRAASNYLNLKPNPDAAKAKAAADKALAIAPNDAAANFYAGIALADQGKSKDALTYLNKADAAAKAANNTTLADAIEKNIKQLSGSKQ